MEGFMFWTGLFIGIFLGANIGIVVAGLLFSPKKNDAENHSTQTPMDYAVMDEIEEVQGEQPPLPKPVTYLDRYPHS
jgi:gas vesicle protein